MIAEDAALLETVVKPLRQQGYQLTVALDRDEGWLLFVMTRPSVLLLDLDLGRMAGMTLLSRVRARNQDAVVIALTRNEGGARRAAAMELGATHVLQPPWTIADLERILGPPPQAPGGPQRTVLLIDDDAAIRQLVRQTLEDEGYTVVEAGTGAEGLRRVRETPVDVVLTDIIMPDGDGLEVVRELRRDFPTIRIIAFTGGRLEWDYSATARLLGAHETLMKPLTPEQVLAAVARQIGMRPPPDSV